MKTGVNRKLLEADPLEECGEAKIAADVIEEWMHFDKLQHVRLLLISSFHPNKCLFLVADAQISIHHGASRNVTSSAELS